MPFLRSTLWDKLLNYQSGDATHSSDCYLLFLTRKTASMLISNLSVGGGLKGIMQTGNSVLHVSKALLVGLKFTSYWIMMY